MSQIASDAKISSAMTALGMTAPLPNLDDSQVLKAILVALGNVTGGGGATGGVVGPASSTNGAVALWNGTTGKLLQDSSIFITGGGTIALGGFTLTVPANGTAALLGVANTFTAAQTVSGASLTLSGNQSSPAWTTTGIRLIGIAGTLTDTTSAGTVAAAYTNRLGDNTIAATNATAFTNYVTSYHASPVAGTNVTFTQRWGLGTDRLMVDGNGSASQPVLALTGTPFTGGSATTTKPLALIETAGATSTNWNTSGTMFGVNAASGFGGSLISAQVASAERFRVQANGVIQLNGDTGGTISRRSDVNMIMLNSVGAGSVGVVGIGGLGFLQGISLSLGSGLTWTNDTPASTADITLRRQAAGILDLSATGSTSGAALQFSEQTAPAAPAANSVRIYAVDNGSGKTQLMALFSSGAAQQIAIQP